MGKNSLGPGFRFHPTDVELVVYYLKRKVLGKKLSFEAISEVDIYRSPPWDLPDQSASIIGDLKWYFFCPMEKKYGKGSRFNRANDYGYWKATGKDRPVRHNDKVVGMIKTLVFHRGKAPRGERTDWVMHEYRLEGKDLCDKGVLLDAYVLCVIFCKDGPGHRNGAQYGAPFREEDWSDNDEVKFVETASSIDMSTEALPTAPNVCFHQNQCIGLTAETTCFADSSSVALDENKSVTIMEADYSSSPEEDSIFSFGRSSTVANANDALEFSKAADFSVDDDIFPFLATFTEDGICIGLTAETTCFTASSSVALDENKSVTILEADYSISPEEDSIFSYGRSSPVANANDALEFWKAADFSVDDDIFPFLATFTEDGILNDALYQLD